MISQTYICAAFCLNCQPIDLGWDELPPIYEVEVPRTKDVSIVACPNCGLVGHLRSYFVARDLAWQLEE